jgi:hypothetical protein
MPQKPPPLYKGVCQYRYCNKKFMSISPYALYCSDAHRQAEYRERLADKEKQEGERPSPPVSDSLQGI